MITDIIKSIYLFFFRLVFMWFNRRPLEDKVVMYVTFPQNSLFLTKELLSRSQKMDIILVCNENSYSRLAALEGENVKLLEMNSAKSYFTRIAHLATAKVIIIDNYFPFLAVTNFKKNVRCVQIWHAAGAIKSFGLEANNTTTRTAISQRRFKRVYNRFDKIVVGSDEMAEIFKRAFGVQDSSFLRTGVPRTDLFFSKEHQTRLRSKFYRHYPQAKGKKVIVYAPTYRDSLNTEFKLDFSTLADKLGNEYLFLIKLHPVTKQQIAIPKYALDRFIQVDATEDVNELLLASDLLITDYSSIPFEYCLLNKPMVFFAYDLQEYITERGIWENYEEFVPGPVVYTTEQLEQAIETELEANSHQKVKHFCETWNMHSKGCSSKNLIDYVMTKF